MAETDIPKANELAKDPLCVLVGEKANGCWVGYGSILYLEFGELRPTDRLQRHPSGEWSMWCDQILWRIEQSTDVLAGSEDGREHMAAAVAQLNGRILLSTAIDQDTGDSIFTFSEAFVLRTFVLTAEEDARWNFRHGSADVVLIGPPPRSRLQTIDAKKKNGEGA